MPSAGEPSASSWADGVGGEIWSCIFVPIVQVCAAEPPRWHAPIDQARTPAVSCKRTRLLLISQPRNRMRRLCMRKSAGRDVASPETVQARTAWARRGRSTRNQRERRQEDLRFSSRTATERGCPQSHPDPAAARPPLGSPRMISDKSRDPAKLDIPLAE